MTSMNARTIVLSSTLALITALGPAAVPVPAEAATVRTTLVETINSIELLATSADVYLDLGPTPITLYHMQFSIQAFHDAVTVPRQVSRGTSTAANLEYVVETRSGDTVTSGVSGGFLASEAPMSGGTYRIAPGTSEVFDLYVAFADTPVRDREDRVRVNGLSLSVDAGEEYVADLNPSELSPLATNYAELFQSRVR